MVNKNWRVAAKDAFAVFENDTLSSLADVHLMRLSAGKLAMLAVHSPSLPCSHSIAMRDF